MRAPSPTSLFVSSVQKELAAERRAVKVFIEGDALLRRFFEVFLFEDLPASGRRADEVYLSEVDRCAIYVGLFGNEYGVPDEAGLSPTEREFDRATAASKERLVFVKGADDSLRQPKMAALVRKAGALFIRRRFGNSAELIPALYASLVDYLSDRLEVWNPGTLPPSLTLEKLRHPHGSVPGNPLLAESLYLAKYIERMGTGTGDMIERCRAAGLPEPEFTLTDGFVTTLRRKLSTGQVAGQPAGEVTPPVGTQSAPSRHQVEILRMCLTDTPLLDLMKLAERSDRTKFRHQVLNPLLAEGLIERTIPGKPTSRLQKYRLTAKGRAWLAALPSKS